MTAEIYKTELVKLLAFVSVFFAGVLHADDIAIVNARIVTMDDANPTASTLLISENRIVSVDDRDASEIADQATTVIDAQDAIVIPGIIDQHLHWNRSAVTWGYALHAGENAFTLADLEAALKARAEEVPAGAWIALIGRHNHLQFLVDPDDPDSGRYPTREELDEWVPDHRVLFSQRFRPTPVGTGRDDFNRAEFSGPGQLNSAAIEFFNAMDASMPAIDTISPDGALDSELSDQVYLWTRANNPLEEQVRSTIDLVRWSHSVGLVGVGDAGGIGFRQTQDFLPLIEAERRGELTVRNRYQLRPTGYTGVPDVTAEAGVSALRTILSAAPLSESRECVGPEELSGEGYHLSRVGGPFFKNMGIGEAISPPVADAIADAAIFVLRRPDWSFHQHSEADQISRVIEGLQRAVSTDDPCRIGSLEDRHSSMEHLNDATPENLTDMAALGVGAGIQAVRFLFPGWQYSGPPYRSAVDTPGLNYGFGADGMFAAHGNPWTTLQFMVTGEAHNGRDILSDDPLGRGAQQISLMEGLQGMTSRAAWFTREEHERGQLKAGYLADVVILDRDPFAADERQIRDTRAALTIVDGKIVYSDGYLPQ
ncbi:MAG: amidohydrolase family protein [Gammaproteobacteria bacterium]